MKKHRWLFLTIIMTISLLLSACGGAEKSSGGKNGKITLTIYSAAGGDEYYKDIVIPMFEEATDGKYNVEYGRGTPQEVINKIKTQGKNGTIDLVVTGLDGLPLGIKEGLWEKILPEYSEETHSAEWNEIGQEYIDKFEGYGAPVTTGSGGPILMYNTKTVKNPPKTYEELRKWIKENPGKFTYPAVPSSGPARGFFFGLIQAMGEDLNNPSSLDKTWDYLEEIGETIEYYPAKTSDSFDLLYEGAVDIVPHIPFWYADNKAIKTIPPHIEAVKLEDAKQVIDSQFYVMVKDLPEDRKNAALEFLKFATSKEIQAQGYVRGFLPANSLATPDMLEPKYQKSYETLVESVMPELKEGDKMKVPDGEWILFPDLEETNELYGLWEEKIQALK